jgi:hypothetical protein
MYNCIWYLPLGEVRYKCDLWGMKTHTTGIHTQGHVQQVSGPIIVQGPQ